MLNNQIIVHDGRGRLDAAELSDSDWGDLCVRNRPSTRVRLVQCLWCWDEHRSVQWLRTYNQVGIRVVSHQPGEAADHPYEALETPEHRAYNERFAHASEAEGWSTSLESRASDGRTRADVRIEGDRTITFEHQHSPFDRHRGPLKRTRLAVNAGVDSVFWHTDDEAIQRVARATAVAMLRNNRLPLAVISKPNVPILLSSGYREIRFWPCAARDGHLCPQRNFAGCGQVHARSDHIGALELDDVARRAPAGLLLPIHVEGVAGPADFITDLASYQRYEEWSGKSGAQLLNGRPTRPGAARKGRRHGHSGVVSARDFTDETQTHRPSVEPRRGSACGECGAPTLLLDGGRLHRCFRCRSQESGAQPVIAPTASPSAPGVCGHYLGAEQRYCRSGDHVRRFLVGHRCRIHTPAALAGRPELPPGPGWPRDRAKPGADH